MQLRTQLNFGGNCREAFEFYAKHLGGKVTVMMARGDAPGSSGATNGDKNAIIHARITIAGTELIGNDVPPDIFQPVRSSYLYLSVDSASDAERVYNALKEDGKIHMPLGETFFAERFAMLHDRFGVGWSVIREKQM